MKKVVLYIIGLINVVQIINAQKIDITGRIVNTRLIPIEYANIQLLQKDSTFIKGTVSDKKGLIKLEADGYDDYFLKISAIGYTPSFILLTSLTGNIDLGDISLIETIIGLDSVTVTANRIIHKIDRQIAFPGKLEVESSNNGFELLGKMSLNRLQVDDINKKISLIGDGSVQIRINGIPATVNDLYAIPAKEIIRVEYHDNPGAQYQEDAMLDFIVKRRESGGYASIDAKSALHLLKGDDMVMAKFNHKNSEWSAFYSLSYRDYKNRWADSEIHYTTPYEEFTKQQTGIPSPFYYQSHDVKLSYNYTLVDKRVINAIFRGNFFHNYARNMNRNTYSNQPEREFTDMDVSKSPLKSPSIDIYYKENISKTQDLYFNLVGGYNYANYIRNYQEKGDQEDVISYVSDVTGKKYYMIAEGDHEKRWGKASLYSGIKYNIGYTKNDYLGTVNRNTSLNNSSLYMYTQLQGRIRKIAYSLGAGVSYSYFSDESKGFKFWTFRPAVSLAYSPIAQLQIRYMFNSRPYIPSLSQLSNVEQVVDQCQVTKGNPDLKPYRGYTNQLFIGYQSPKIQCNVGGYHNFYRKVIMQDVFWSNLWNRFVFTDNNQQHWQQTVAYVNINYQIIKDMLNLNCYGQIAWTNSKGNNYDYKYTSYYGSVQANFFLKGWRASAQIASRYNSLWGESIYEGEWPTFVINGGYKYKDLYVGVSCWGLFTDKASYGYENLSPVYQQKHWSYISDSSPIVSLQVKWEISWGKKSNAGMKTINNSDSDNGILMVK